MRIQSKERSKDNEPRARPGVSTAVVSVVAALMGVALHVQASAYEIINSLGSLEELILGIVQAIGVIVVIWGVFDLGMGYMSHDGTQQTNGLKRIVAGLIMFFVSYVLALLQVAAFGYA